MKNHLLSLILFIAGTSAIAQPSPRSVQVAILFDTSNSMDGLIDQAKSRIWNIVNEVGSLTYNGMTPNIEFALYQYGNDGLTASENYIKQELDLTSDLDEVSQKLFGLTTFYIEDINVNVYYYCAFTANIDERSFRHVNIFSVKLTFCCSCF